MKGRTEQTEMNEAPKSRKQSKKKAVMVAGAKRNKAMYGMGGAVMGTKRVARGMGDAVKGGNFTD